MRPIKTAMQTGNAMWSGQQVHESIVELHTLVHQPLVIKKGTTPENETLTLNRYARLLLQAKLELANSCLQRHVNVGLGKEFLWQAKHMTGLCKCPTIGVTASGP